MAKKRQCKAHLFSIGALAILLGCSTPSKKMNPSTEYTTDSGFQFRFPMAGEWHPGPPQKGMYMVGQKPGEDGISKVAIVRHGPILTQDGKTMTNKEILNGFQRDIENEAKSGRVTKAKSQFARTKYKDADCLTFEQTGEDLSGGAAMNMNNEGMICLHPTRPYHFVWMALSERWFSGNSESPTYRDDKQKFLNSLKFNK